MTDEELSQKFKSIEQQFKELKERPVAVSGGDPEFFGQPGQLDDVERKLEAVIQCIDRLRRGFAQEVEQTYRALENAGHSALSEEIADAVFLDESDFARDKER